jgi:tetratricopeptide (TPR) repeat protein
MNYSQRPPLNHRKSHSENLHLPHRLQTAPGFDSTGGHNLNDLSYGQGGEASNQQSGSSQNEDGLDDLEKYYSIKQPAQYLRDPSPATKYASFHEWKDIVNPDEPRHHVQSRSARTINGHSGGPDGSEQTDAEQCLRELERRLNDCLRDSESAKLYYEREIEALRQNYEDEIKKIGESHKNILDYKLWSSEVREFEQMKLINHGDLSNADRIYKRLVTELTSAILDFNQKLSDQQEPSATAISDCQRDLLRLHNAYLRLQIDHNNYALIEEVVTTDLIETWINEDAEECRLGYSLWCEALRKQGPEKYNILERSLRKIWPNGGPPQPSQDGRIWMLHLGDQLCDVLELLGDLQSGIALRERLRKDREAVQGERHNDTVLAGLSLARSYLKRLDALEPRHINDPDEIHHKSISKVAIDELTKVWRLWNDDKNWSETTSAILTGGHMLGQLHYCQRTEKGAREAQQVLRTVWEARKALAPHISEDTILTGHYLFLAYAQLKEYSEAKVIFEELWHTLKFMHKSIRNGSILKFYYLLMDFLAQNSNRESWRDSAPEIFGYQAVGNKNEVLVSCVEVGMVLFYDKKYMEAESILREAYNTYKTDDGLGRSDEMFSCGRRLATVLAAQERFLDAAQIFQQVFDDRAAMRLHAESEDELEALRVYGDVLMKLASFVISPSPNLEGIESLYRRSVVIFNHLRQTGFAKPEMRESARHLLLALVKLGELHDASSLCTEILNYDQDISQDILSVSFLHELCKTAVDRDDYDMARTAFGLILNRSDDVTEDQRASEVEYYYGVCLMKQGQHQQALDIFSSARRSLRNTSICQKLDVAYQQAEEAVDATVIGEVSPTETGSTDPRHRRRTTSDPRSTGATSSGSTKPRKSKSGSGKGKNPTKVTEAVDMAEPSSRKHNHDSKGKGSKGGSKGGSNPTCWFKMF